MAPVAIEPREVVADVASRSHTVADDDAPLPLSRPAAPGPTLAPVREDDRVAAVHAAWERVHAVGSPPGRSATGVAGRLGGRVDARVDATVGAAQRDDRALIGDLIRAADALATRCDELADRLVTLEALVEEVVCVVSEDLTHLRAVVATIASTRPSVGDAVDHTPVGESGRASAMDG